MSRRSKIESVSGEKIEIVGFIWEYFLRVDNITKECPEVSIATNYDGYCYFGEYPLSFAAVLQQEESVRLLVAKGANTNCQDSNGNTALHMCVIYNRLVRLKLFFLFNFLVFWIEYGRLTL